MKRRVLREWVELLLWGVMFIMFLIASAECKSNFLFLIKSIICLVIIILDGKVLYKYGKYIKK